MMFSPNGTKKLATALFAVMVLFGAQEGATQSAASTSIHIQKEISVAAGETLTLERRKLVNIVVETFTLEDNAVVRLAPGTETVFIRAKHARIGEGVPASCIKFGPYMQFIARNTGFSDRSSVWLMFTASEDKPHAGFLNLVHNRTESVVKRM